MDGARAPQRLASWALSGSVIPPCLGCSKSAYGPSFLGRSLGCELAPRGLLVHRPPFQPENKDGSYKGRGEELLAEPGVFLGPRAPSGLAHGLTLGTSLH